MKKPITKTELIKKLDEIDVGSLNKERPLMLELYKNWQENGFADDVDDEVLASDNNRLIRYSAEFGCIELFKYLLELSRKEGSEINPTDKDSYAVRWASLNGHTWVVDLLLKDPRVDPTAKGNYAIQWASGNGHKEVVRLLLADNRVDPAADENLAINWAIKNGWASNNGHIEVIRLLLSYIYYGKNPQNPDEVALNKALKEARDNDYAGLETKKYLFQSEEIIKSDLSFLYKLASKTKLRAENMY